MMLVLVSSTGEEDSRPRRISGRPSQAAGRRLGFQRPDVDLRQTGPAPWEGTDCSRPSTCRWPAGEVPGGQSGEALKTRCHVLFRGDSLFLRIGYTRSSSSGLHFTMKDELIVGKSLAEVLPKSDRWWFQQSHLLRLNLLLLVPLLSSSVAGYDGSLMKYASIPQRVRSDDADSFTVVCKHCRNGKLTSTIPRVHCSVS